MYRINLLMPGTLFKLDFINLDRFSESFTLDYYLYYLKTYTEDCYCISDMSDMPIGYVLSKLECQDKSVSIFNNHLSAISVAPNYRRYKIGSILMNILEDNGNLYNCKFVDLFVRISNKTGIAFYKNRGFIEYRRIYGYYNDEEDAIDMRKSLKHDKEGFFTMEGKDIQANDL